MRIMKIHQWCPDKEIQQKYKPTLVPSLYLREGNVLTGKKEIQESPSLEKGKGQGWVRERNE